MGDWHFLGTLSVRKCMSGPWREKGPKGGGGEGHASRERRRSTRGAWASEDKLSPRSGSALPRVSPGDSQGVEMRAEVKAGNRGKPAAGVSQALAANKGSAGSCLACPVGTFVSVPPAHALRAPALSGQKATLYSLAVSKDFWNLHGPQEQGQGESLCRPQ